MHKKLEQKIWRKFITVSCTTTTLRPITLHGSCHVLDSFCAGIELCSIVCVKLVPGKTLYQIVRNTCKFPIPDDLHKFLVQVSWACVADIGLDCTGCLMSVCCEIICHAFVNVSVNFTRRRCVVTPSRWIIWTISRTYQTLKATIRRLTTTTWKMKRASWNLVVFVLEFIHN